MKAVKQSDGYIPLKHNIFNYHQTIVPYYSATRVVIHAIYKKSKRIHRNKIL